MIDTSRSIETPEGVQLDLRPAGMPVRLMAWVIDMAIRLALYMVLGILFSFLGRVGMGFWLISLFLMEWFYPVLFEVLARGQSPGKMAMGIRVLGEDGTPVDWSRSMVRSLVMFVDFLPVLYGTGLIAMLVQRDGKRLGDLAAGTLVVYGEKRIRHRAHAVHSEQLGTIAGTPPPVSLALDEQRAIIAFSERIPTLTSERSIELANLLSPLTKTQGPDAIKRLCAMAADFSGQSQAERTSS